MLVQVGVPEKAGPGTRKVSSYSLRWTVVHARRGGVIITLHTNQRFYKIVLGNGPVRTASFFGPAREEGTRVLVKPGSGILFVVIPPTSQTGSTNLTKHVGLLIPGREELKTRTTFFR